MCEFMLIIAISLWTYLAVTQWTLSAKELARASGAESAFSEICRIIRLRKWGTSSIRSLCLTGTQSEVSWDLNLIRPWRPTGTVPSPTLQLGGRWPQACWYPESRVKLAGIRQWSNSGWLIRHFWSSSLSVPHPKTSSAGTRPPSQKT